jgi:predicted permease
MIAGMFANAGNYGLSLTFFAFGHDGLAYAGIYFVTTATLINSVGVIIASLGSTDLKGALIGLLKVPSIYAVLIALATNYFNWSLAVPLERTISVLADAAVPTLLILLGIQLHRTQWYRGIQALSLSTGIRLIVSPALALVFSLLFGLHGTAQQAIIAESATPTAVMATVLATEFNIKPAYISAAVFVSTLISPLTITPILALLRA